MSSSCFRPCFLVNLGKLIPGNRPEVGEGEAFGGESGTVDEGEGKEAGPGGPCQDHSTQNTAPPLPETKLAFTQHLLWAS